MPRRRPGSNHGGGLTDAVSQPPQLHSNCTATVLFHRQIVRLLYCPARVTTMPLAPHAEICLEKNWPRFAALVALIASLLDGSNIFTRALRSRVLKLVRPAESMARRLLVLMALKDASSFGRLRLRLHKAGKAPDVVSIAGTAPHPEPVEGRAPHAPSLRLFEPYPDFGLLCSEPPARPETPLDTEQADRSAEPVNDAPTLARLAALQAVLANSHCHVRRMARWLARHTRRPGRTSPLGVGPPPGAVQRPPDRPLNDALRDCHYFAREALATCRAPPIVERPHRNPPQEWGGSR